MLDYKLYNLVLTDKRSHHKLIIRVWAMDEEGAKTLFYNGGLDDEYTLRYIRQDEFYTK